MPAVLCCCCCYCGTVLATSEKSPSLHSIHPIELPALVINSEPCAVTAGLWTQQLAAGRQALFHRVCPLISCTQLSSSSPAIQSAAAAAGEGGLFHCCHWPCCRESPSPYFLFHLFLPTVSALQTHPLSSHAAGLICRSRMAFLSFFLSQTVHLSLPLLTFSLLFPSCFLSPTHSPPVCHAGSLDELSFYCLRPCPFCLSVLWYPFLFSVFVGCHVSVSPLLSSQFCPVFFVFCCFFLPLALISARFPSRSLSLCHNLNYASFFPNVTILYLFFPLFL